MLMLVITSVTYHGASSVRLVKLTTEYDGIVPIDPHSIFAPFADERRSLEKFLKDDADFILFTLL